MNSVSEEVKLQKEEIRNKLVLAKRYLKDSQIALQNGGIRLATDGAYNAAELIMKAAILYKGETIPKRHGGIAQKFSLLFIKTEELHGDIGGKVKNSFKFRNKARYEEKARITKEQAGHNIELAEELIEFLEKKLKLADIPK